MISSCRLNNAYFIKVSQSVNIFDYNSISLNCDPVSKYLNDPDFYI